MTGRARQMAFRLLVVVACLWPMISPAQTTVKYVHTDALGSVVAMTDGSGAVVEATREYEPYGQQLTPAVQDGPGYTGHVQDAATGLTYMQQRYYDPGIGLFLSVDPVTAYGGDIRHFNRYAYAYNNPYKFTDPDGRCPVCKIGVDFALEVGIQYATTGTVDVGAALTETAKGALNPLKTVERVRDVARIVKGGDKVGDAARSRYKPGGDFSRRTKSDTAANADNKCEYCGTDTVQAKRSERGVTPPRNEGVTDHVTPKSRGGDNSPGNAAHACRDCNEKFSDNPKPHPRDDLQR